MKKEVRRVQTGAYPRSIGWDTKGEWIYAQDFDHQLKVYDNKSGDFRSEFQLADRGSDQVRFTSHPAGKGRLLVTLVGGKPQSSGPARLFFVELR